MERKFKVIYTLLICQMLCSSLGFAQKVSKVHDKAKFYQYRSMEIPGEKWNFHPGWWYAILYPGYSGGSINWKFQVKFKESKSTVGRIGPTRIAEATMETLTSEHLTHQVDSIKEIAIEETAAAAERQQNLIYYKYQSVFNDLFQKIDNMLSNIETNNFDGYLTPYINALIDERTQLKEEISYINGVGPMYQMETAKRQIAFEEVEAKLSDLSDRAFTIVRLGNIRKKENDLMKE